jgi:hypothetical protein
MYYQDVHCHLCGNLVCQTCGCCQSPSCELGCCPEIWEDRKEYLQEKEKEKGDNSQTRLGNQDDRRRKVPS